MFQKEFKTAIQNLPDTQKDKLILRLLRRDLDLANKLYFELVSTQTVEQKRAEISTQINEKIKLAQSRFFSLQYLLLDIRQISGDINYHVKITTDKFGEIVLNLQMLIQALSIPEIANQPQYPKLDNYIIARIFKILLLQQKLDSDYFIEIKNDLITLGNLISQNKTLFKSCIYSGLDINWLLQSEIPENLSDIHKNIKANGFLK